MASTLPAALLDALSATRIGRRAALAYRRCWATATARYPPGTNVFEREWDLLVVLDACRVDALRTVAPEYDFLGPVDSVTSVGSTSSEWIANTFRLEHSPEIARTACVTSNAYVQAVVEDRQYPGGTDHVVAPDALAVLDQPWRYVPDEQVPFFHVPPRYVTDQAVAVARSHDPGRLLVHYRPPHAPYTAGAIAEDRDLASHEKDPFGALRDGVDPELVWAAYLDELRRGLDEAARLLRNVNAERVVITADHGEAFGEWGVYGHPMGMLHPTVRRVPWVETTATDTGTYEPSAGSPRDAGSRDVDEHLRNLGYDR